MSDAQALRTAIVAALEPIMLANHGEAPPLRDVYVPPSHIKALRLDCNLVVGARGVGKSFWTAALGASELRPLLGGAIPDLGKTDVSIGFSKAQNPDAFPDADTIAHLLTIQGVTAKDVWRGVIARWLGKMLREDVPATRWDDTLSWVKSDPEAMARMATRANQLHQTRQTYGLILFDALDLTSDNWATMDDIVRELLRCCLWLKSFPRLHSKVFLREDQFARPVTDFPDASKLLATRAELNWAPHDLHGMLWQLLCNADGAHGELLRQVYERVTGTPPLNAAGIWRLPDEIKREGPAQRALFAALAGPWMGRDHRRGVPYVWTVSHLADGKLRTTPRSFCTAIREAANDSAERYAADTVALHFESIKRGVQVASRNRVDELVAEDHPWVKDIMEPLRGLTVPCEFVAMEAMWQKAFPTGLDLQVTRRLPPLQSLHDWPGVRDHLKRLGILETMKDGRINLPDLYRVGFGLGRHGGVKPLT